MQYQEYTYAESRDTFRTFLTKTFTTMTLGLIVSALVAFVIAYMFPSLSLNFFVFLIVAFAQIGVTIYFSSRLSSMSASSARLCFVIYSVLTGVTFSTLFLVYDLGSIAMAFTMTAVVFACMSIIGHTTKMDLTKFTPYFIAGLFAIIISTLLNSLFFHSYAMNNIINYLAIIVFLGLVAYDMQTLRHLYASGIDDPEMRDKLSIYGAFQLYLDFINLFVRILQIFGRSNSDN